MASYFAKLSSLVSGGSAFPYTLGDSFGTAWGCWTHYAATHRDTGEAVSVFRIASARKSEPKMVAARNGVKCLRTLRHPNVLQFKDAAEMEVRGETVILLVTEFVTPLQEHLNSLDIQGPARSQYLAMGLCHVVTAVSFLNNDCKLIHGNVCMAAVVVSESLDWRLHGFDLLSEHSGPANMSLINAAWMVGSQYKPGEVGRGEWALIPQGPPWAVDAWGLGCLLQETFSGALLSSAERLRDTKSIPPGVLKEYQRLLSSQPERRLNPAKLAANPVLHNRLVDITAFLENLSVKDGMEKDNFFKTLPAQLPAIPSPVAQKKLLPMLGQALEFGGAPTSALSLYLKIAATLEDEAYTVAVVPTVARLFASNDRSLRRSLLENIDLFAKHFSEDLVESKVFPAIAAGFVDTNAYIRELTLKSMLPLAPLLSQRTITQILLKHLAKLQVDEEPPIRANTTILLGNLAVHLGEATQKRVLLNAFTRALKDGFPPARIAGIRAVVATADLYSAGETAQRIIPAIAPLTVDAVECVRELAISAITTFVKVLSTNHASMVANAKEQATSSGKGVENWSSGLGSNLGWAISSFARSRDDSGLDSGQSGHAATVASPTGAPLTAGNSTSPAAIPPTSTAPRAPEAPSSSASVQKGWQADSLDGWQSDTSNDADSDSGAQPAAPPVSSVHVRHVALPSSNDSWDEMSRLGIGDSASSNPAPKVPRAPLPRRGGRAGRSGAAGSRGGMKLGANKLTQPKQEVDFSEW